MCSVLQMAKNYRNKLKQCAILMMEVTNRIQPTHSFGSLKRNNIVKESYVYWTLHHLDS